MISLSVALDENKGIGINNRLPWHIKEELKIFKENTLNKHIIMGRTTYEGLPNTLENRIIIVVSRDDKYKIKDIDVINDLEEFLIKHQDDEEEYVICGGSSIYKIAYPYCKVAYVSFIKGEYETDTKFEDFKIEDFDIEYEKEYEKFTYRLLKRRN